MARKQESISEQVVRLYKEGHNLDDIATFMQMNKGGAQAILEKYMPDYEEYKQPVPSAPLGSPANGNGVMSKISSPFKKKKKNDSSGSAVATATSINLNYDENGFIDKHTESIAKMIRRGDSEKKIAEFFNCTIGDVKAVKGAMDQMTAEAKAAPQAPASAPVQSTASEEEFNPFMSDKIKRDNNLSKMAEEKAAEQPQEYVGYDPYGPDAVLDPYAVKYDPNAVAAEETAEYTDTYTEQTTDAYATDEYTTQEYTDQPVAAEDTFSIDEFITEKPTTDENGEYIPDIKFEDDELGEMPSISTDDLVFEEPLATASNEAIEAIDDVHFDMDSVDSVQTPTETETESEQISFELKESDAEMTPMEKMKMFAKQQIDENNSKLESLNAEKDKAANELAHDEAELAATRTSISECEEEISQLNAQLSEINEKLTDLSSKLSEYQLTENQLLDATVRNRAAAQELDNSIAEILKENADYETYLN